MWHIAIDEFHQFLYDIEAKQRLPAEPLNSKANELGSTNGQKIFDTFNYFPLYFR